jgi:spermidine synthase
MPLEILDYESTPLGTLCLRRRELVSRPGTIVTEVTLDHEFLMSSYLTESERALARIGLEKVSDHIEGKLNVLVGGLGLGYTANECLKSARVASVEVVEFLPQVIGWLDRGLIPLAGQLAGDGRLNVTHGDVYARVAEEGVDSSKPGQNPIDQGTAERFDLIVIDVDHSPQDVLGDQSHGFYTREGLRRTREQLTVGGVLGVWSYAEDTPLLANLKQELVDVDVQQVTVWNDLIDVEQTDWLFFGRREA